MTETLVNELELQQEETQRNKYLTFVVEKEYYGIEIRYVTEIIGIQSITEVPDLPEYIRGIINLRGKIIPVMDVRLRFGKKPREYDDRTCIIVIDINDMFVGLIVDSVCEVMSIPDGEIVVPPDFDQNENRFIKGIGKTGNEVRLILDCEKLLKD
ncbi:purine-binding chemotaxis protein CheW [Acetivibrio thermocellus AD2]|jgi:purine-binding chemotaxis protein CheW|uniref:Purine-binding chemotaxis protein CheW n=1 Tax=Acetivibrio thermocellus AD2 TaxID=1138384 RepID=A0AB36THW6_ACETH|nr:chemotaxis protein CheW [Acetivibrio thermocellus]ADU75234.1 CheW protein [Acetivibrio thermocellus DSM 1313]ALX09209.1 CheW protein [Acetivibrio thermocellus AD2]ANV76961.1 CheW protein [Acetivibrio thermocellus DSM 2360]EIC04821.1 CheW domain protein [Acetivibrio thermocellus YS]PFH03484.1 purine-binding chemotaxis protein CheW [Acetivibrio thermocellus AD2]